METDMTKTPDWMRIKRPTRHLPFGVEKEIDQTGKTGFVLILLILAAIAVVVWMRH
jgi:hypothetical protein